MKRYDIINKLIKENNYKSYLEIGTQLGQCLSRIVCEYKVGVDPAPINIIEGSCNEHYEVTSDMFFDINIEKFDIIFIDGLHHSDQVIIDINNSLDVLNENGCIVVHDSSPEKEEYTCVPERHLPTWNGDTYKAILHFRQDPDLFIETYNTDQGCAVIRKGSQEPLGDVVINWENFDKNRAEWLNLI